MNNMTDNMSEMNEAVNKIIEVLKERFDAQVYEFRAESSLIVKPDQIVDVCQVLHDEYNFEWLVIETAVDYWPDQNPRFHVVYRIRSVERNLIMGLRVPLDGDNPTVPSIEDIYHNANWFERELWDLFGIKVTNHSDLRRIMMPHDWEGHPLRKDYPLGYEEVQFTFNFDEIEKRKNYAKE